MIVKSSRAAGYSADVHASSVFHLAPPDAAQLPQPTRTALDWHDAAWIERDPATGRVLARGDVSKPAQTALAAD